MKPYCEICKIELKSYYYTRQGFFKKHGNYKYRLEELEVIRMCKDCIDKTELDKEIDYNNDVFVFDDCNYCREDIEDYFLGFDLKRKKEFCYNFLFTECPTPKRIVELYKEKVKRQLTQKELDEIETYECVRYYIDQLEKGYCEARLHEIAYNYTSNKISTKIPNTKRLFWYKTEITHKWK